MPRYVKGTGKFQKKRKWGGFRDVQHLKSFLTRTNPKDEMWHKHFRTPAKAYKRKKPFLHKRSLRAVATKHPTDLAGDVLSEMLQAQKGEPVGGGISETLFWFASQAANLVGLPKFQEWIGAGYEHREIPREEQIFAKATDATYFEIGQRPAEIDGLVRLPEYDQDRYSVWKQPNGQYLITIRGTRGLSALDVASDVGIALGGPMQSLGEGGVQEIFTKFDREGKHYDVSAHSLGTQYVQNGTHENVDSIYLFSPASSPLMNSDYLEEQANNKDYTYFINPSDPVSEAMWHKMSNDYVDTNTYVGNYAWSPLAAHSVSQWYPDLEDLPEPMEVDAITE